MSSPFISLKEIIKKYQLKPHIEGGFANLLYEDAQTIKVDELSQYKEGSTRPLWNGIYYLLPNGGKCILHRIRMSELWNFYLGGPLELFDISPQGQLKTTFLGQNIEKSQKLAYVFPPGHWIGAIQRGEQDFSLVSCITCPGFTFEDWEKGERQKLLEEFPHLKEVIVSLTNL